MWEGPGPQTGPEKLQITEDTGGTELTVTVTAVDYGYKCLAIRELCTWGRFALGQRATYVSLLTAAASHRPC